MKIADMDWYFDLKDFVIKNNISREFQRLNMNGGHAIYYKYFFDTSLRYSSFDDEKSEIAFNVYLFLREKNVTIYDSETGKNKRVHFADLPAYLAKNEVINLGYDQNSGFLQCKSFVLNRPGTIYNGNIMMYSNTKGKMFFHSDDFGGCCFKMEDFLLDEDYIQKVSRTGGLVVFGLKFWQKQIKFYYRQPSKYYYVGTGYYPVFLIKMTEMSREEFIRNIKIGKFDLFG